jgi:hypothetical protein
MGLYWLAASRTGVHPVSPYCTDILRCMAHKTLSANLSLQNWVITLRSSKFCHPHSKINNFPNTGKQRNKFTTLIIYKCVFGVRHKCWAVWMSALFECCHGWLVTLCGVQLKEFPSEVLLLHGNTSYTVCWTVTKITVFVIYYEQFPISFIHISLCVLKWS